MRAHAHTHAHTHLSCYHQFCSRVLRFIMWIILFKKKKQKHKLPVFVCRFSYVKCFFKLVILLIGLFTSSEWRNVFTHRAHRVTCFVESFHPLSGHHWEWLVLLNYLCSYLVEFVGTSPIGQWCVLFACLNDDILEWWHTWMMTYLNDDILEWWRTWMMTD